MLGQAINNGGASANTDACGNNNSFTIENENCMETRGYHCRRTMAKHPGFVG